MKIFLVSILVGLSLGVFAQSDTVSQIPWIRASYKIGNFSGSLFPNSNVNGTATNPQLSFGKNVRANLGFMIVRFDTTEQAVDSADMLFTRFQLGLSFEQEIRNTNLYVGGAYDLMPANRGRGVGNMVSMRMGYLLQNRIDFSVQSSKIFGRSPEPSGTILLFGFGLRF